MGSKRERGHRGITMTAVRAGLPLARDHGY
jgi:hypothetical protein